MATQQLNFNIRIGYDDAAVGPGAQRTEAQLRGLVTEVERVAREMAAARNRTEAAADGFNRLGVSLATAAKGFAVYQAGSLALNLGQTARTLQDMETRLQGVTSATGGYAQAEQFLIDLATRHHKTLTGLADGYTSLLALEESGILTRKEAQRMMEGLSNAQSKYGTSNEQIKQSLYGLSQALSASNVQMDELHQVTDPMPGLLTRMERAAGLASGGFKDMAEKGQLTRDIVKDSLIKTLGDLDGAAAKTAGTMTASVNDMQREWELLAKAAEEPITFVVNISSDAASKALKAIRENFEAAHNFWNSNDLSRYSLPDLQANLGYLQKAGPEKDWMGNVNAAGQKNYDYEIKQYQDAIALKQKEVDSRNAAQPAANTGGFTGPTIPDDVLKQRKKDAEALQEQYQKLLEQAGNYREALTLEAKAKGLSEDASRTYVEQGLKLIEQKTQEHSSHSASAKSIQNYADALRDATSEIEMNRRGMERQSDAVRQTMEAEKAIELIRAGSDRSAQLEIEARYIENERVLNQQRLQDEVAYDQQLLQTTRNKSQAAELTQQLAQHQTALNAVNDDASKALERLRAAEQARGDALLQQLNTDTADKQQLGALAQRWAMEGQTADQIERQLAAKAQILQIERDNPNRPDITQAAIRNLDQEQTYRQVLDDTRKTADEYTELWKTAARRVDDTFQQLWEDIISGQNSVGGSLKKLLTSSLAELAHATITKPLEQNFLQYVGAPAATSSSLGSGAISGLLGKVENWLSGSAATTTPALPAPGITTAAATTTASSNLVSTLSNGATGAGMAANAAGAGSSFWSIGQSSSLGKIGAGLASKLGFGAGTSGAIGTGFANAPWGAVGSIAAQLLGIQGTNPIANMALPAIGGIAGGALGGTMLGATLGMAAGPIGAILGALAGSALSMLFNDTPKAEARYRYSGGAGSMQLTDAWKRNGGQLNTMKELGSSMYTPLRQLERGFQVNLGQFDTAFYQRDKNVTLWGKDLDGTLFFEEKVKFTEDAINDGMSRFLVSIVKRESVLQQFDGALVQGAVKLSSTVDDLQVNYGRAARIRAYTGDTTETSAATAELFRKNQKFTDNIRELIPDNAAARITELLKVSAATARGFSAIAADFSASLDQLNGSGSNVAQTMRDIDDQHRKLTAQNAELARSAEKLGLSYNKLDQSQIDAARSVAQQAVRDGFVQALRDAAGVADRTAQAVTDLSQQFKQFARDAATLNLEIESVGAAMLGAFSTLAQQIKQPTQNAISGLKLSIAELDGTMDQVLLDVKTQAVAALEATKDKGAYKFGSADHGLALVSAAQTAILASYQQQKIQADALTQAAKSIQEYTKNLTFTPLSTATPKQKLDTAKADYTALQTRITGTTNITEKAALLNQASGVAGQYLESALAYMGPTADYDKIFAAVKSDLDNLGSIVIKTPNYQEETIQQLKALETPLTAIAAMNQAQIQQAASALQALNLLNASQQTMLHAITSGATYTAITDITANVKANAKITGLQTAIDAALTSGGANGKLDEVEAASIMAYITNLGTITAADGDALNTLAQQMKAQAEAYKALGKNSPAVRSELLADAISNLTSGIGNAATATSTATKNARNTREPSLTDSDPGMPDIVAPAANDPWFYKKSDVEAIINAPFSNEAPLQTTLGALQTALSDKGTLSLQLGTLNAAFDGKAPLQTTLGALQTALSDKGTLSLQLGTLNAAFDGKAPLQTMLTGIQSALDDKGTLAGKLTNLNAKLDGNSTIVTTLGALAARLDSVINVLGTNANMSIVQYLDELRTNLLTIDADLYGLDEKAKTAQTTRSAIKTGIEALPPLLTAINTGNQSAAATLAGGMTGFGKALTDGLSSLGSAIYSGMGQVGSAVGAKITDLNTALKTTQNQLATANSALAQAQTALTQAQAAKIPVATTATPKTITIGTPPTAPPVAVTVPAKTTILGTPPTIPARASGGPAQGWTLVGEQGPELVHFPVPVQVYSNDQSRSLLKESTTQDQTEIIASLRRLIELQAATIATLQQQGRNQNERLDGLHREFARFSGKARLAA